MTKRLCTGTKKGDKVEAGSARKYRSTGTENEKRPDGTPSDRHTVAKAQQPSSSQEVRKEGKPACKREQESPSSTAPQKRAKVRTFKFGIILHCKRSGSAKLCFQLLHVVIAQHATVPVGQVALCMCFRTANSDKLT
jgi:hypothetical protein